MKNEVFQNLDVILFSPVTGNFTEPLRLVAMESIDYLAPFRDLMTMCLPTRALKFAFLAAYTTHNLYSR